MKTAKPDETKEMYEKNLALLSPWLKASMSEISDSELREKIEVTYNEEGYPVCRYRQGDVSFHITSEHPIREAKTWYQSIAPGGPAEVFLYGTGFGYALFELFAHKEPHTLVVVFEQDRYLFKAMLYYFDLSQLIQENKIVFLIGDSSYFREAFQKLFYNMLFFGVTHPAVVLSLPAVRNFKTEYLEIHRYLFRDLCFLSSLLGNSHQDNMTGLRNMLANVREILENPYPSCLKEKYRNVPAFIISNGPSLDRSTQKLKGIHGKALILCVESAIVPLTKSGITPDILAIVERTKYTYLYHFKDRNYSPDIALLALAVTDPRVFRSFAGEKIPILRKGEDLNRWFNQNLGDGSELDAGANVSHFAACIAMYLGADPIIFVGQDFAYGPDGLTHSKDAVISQETGKQARERIHAIPTVYVEGNSGTMIPSNRLWADFRLGLEHIIEDHPEHRFYNATDGGARIHGADRAELGELIRQYCVEPIPSRVGELISEYKANISIAERRTRLGGFITDVERYAVLFRNLAKEMNLKKLKCDKMLLLCSREKEQDRRTLEEAYQENIDAFHQFAENGLCRTFFQQLKCAYFHLLDRLGTVDTPEKTAQAFSLQSRFYNDLRVVCQSLSVTLAEAADSLRALSEEPREKAV
ncbi:hypothetical protein A7X67_02885 [Clostridium sp. W14A]|nr:hypothetical protein A7X67_02885 [Clostridium sp. W14A]